jgi:hypothetical protein
LVARQGTKTSVFELEADRAPIELARADGEPFGEILAATRAAGRWFLATAAPLTDLPATVVWQVDAPQVRELVRIPRTTDAARSTTTRLARRADGRAVGLVVDGQPGPTGASLRWVLPIDLESSRIVDPQSLGAADLGDRDAVPFCAEDEPGWVLDATWNATTRVHASGTLVGLSSSSTAARLRLSDRRACVERLAANLDAFGTERAAALARSGGPGTGVAGGRAEPTLPVTAVALHARYPLRCSRQPP